jgi:hypothetical protein
MANNAWMNDPKQPVNKHITNFTKGYWIYRETIAGYNKTKEPHIMTIGKSTTDTEFALYMTENRLNPRDLTDFWAIFRKLKEKG